MPADCLITIGDCTHRALASYGGWEQDGCTPWVKQTGTFRVRSGCNDELCVGETFTDQQSKIWTVSSVKLINAHTKCPGNVIQACCWRMLAPVCRFALVQIKNNHQPNAALEPEIIKQVSGSKLFVGGSTDEGDNLVWPDNTYLFAVDCPIREIRARSMALTDGDTYYIVDRVVDTGCMDSRPHLVTKQSDCLRFD